ncbi:PTS transporter subunit EIIC, partial [Patescibacteria group bacterium]|nr:PTS transporter subunit EIIC [Patescibacteria group bacterium]
MKATKAKSFNDHVFEWVNKNLVPPFTKLSENYFVKSVYEGFASIIGVLMIGSIFILLFGLATNYQIFSFLLPIAMPLLVGYQLTMGLTGLFVAASLSYSLAKNAKLDPHAGMLVGLATFIVLAVTVQDGAIAINNLGAQGIFTAMLSCFVTISVYRFCVKNNITIKMPEGVPPAIANMFTSLIPAAISMLLAWIVRQILGVDLVVFVQGLLAPVFAAVDNIFTFTFRYFLGQL